MGSTSPFRFRNRLVERKSLAKDLGSTALYRTRVPRLSGAIVLSMALISTLLAISSTPGMAATSSSRSVTLAATQTFSTAPSDCSDGQASFDFPTPVKNAQVLVTLSLSSDMILEAQFTDARGQDRYSEDTPVGDPFRGLAPTQFRMPDSSPTISNVTRVDVRIWGRPISTIRSCIAQMVHEGPLMDPISLECLTSGTMTFDLGAARNDVRLRVDLALDSDMLLEWVFYDSGGRVLSQDLVLLGDYFQGLPLQTLVLPDESAPAVSGVTRATARIFGRPLSNIRWCAGRVEWGGGTDGATSVRVMTWNLEGRAWATGGPATIAAHIGKLKEAIESTRADVVGLQEIPGSQAEELRRSLGWELYWAPARTRAQCGTGNKEKSWFDRLDQVAECWRNRNGNAIISRYPLSETKDFNVEPGVDASETRVLVGATVNVSGHQLRFYSVHLSAEFTTPTERIKGTTAEDQVRFVAQTVLADRRQYGEAMPTVVSGDFNSRPWWPAMWAMGWQDNRGNDRGEFQDLWAQGWPESGNPQVCDPTYRLRRAPPGNRAKAKNVAPIPISASPRACGWTNRTKGGLWVRLDYLFVPKDDLVTFAMDISDRWTTLSSGTESEIRRFSALSDHFPVAATIAFGTSLSIAPPTPRDVISAAVAPSAAIGRWLPSGAPTPAGLPDCRRTLGCSGLFISLR